MLQTGVLMRLSMGSIQIYVLYVLCITICTSHNIHVELNVCAASKQNWKKKVYHTYGIHVKYNNVDVAIIIFFCSLSS